MSEVDFDLSVPGGSNPSVERCSRVQSHQLPASEQSYAPGQSVAHGLNHREEESDVDDDFVESLNVLFDDPLDLSHGLSGGMAEQGLLPNAIGGESKATVSTKRLDSESMKLNGDELQNQPVVKKQRVDNEAKKNAAEKRNVVHVTDCLQVFTKQSLPNILSQLSLEPGSTLNKVIGERDSEELIGLSRRALTLAGYPLGQNPVERLHLVFSQSKHKSFLSLILTLIATMGTAPGTCACCTKANENKLREWRDKCHTEFKNLGADMDGFEFQTEDETKAESNRAEWLEKCRKKLGDELPEWTIPPLDKMKFNIFPINGLFMEKDKKTPHKCPYCEHCFVESGKKKTLVEKKDCQCHKA